MKTKPKRTKDNKKFCEKCGKREHISPKTSRCRVCGAKITGIGGESNKISV